MAQRDGVTRSEGKRDVILDAAAMLFGQFGLKKTTMGDIVREAGVARGTVYKYFPTKRHVFSAVVHREQADIIAGVQKAVALETATRERLRACFLAQLEMIGQKINLYRVTIKSISEILPHRDECREHLIAEGEGIVEEILSAGVRTGEISVANVELAAKTVHIAFRGLALGSVFGDSGEDREVIIGSLLDMLLNGMIPRKGET